MFFRILVPLDGSSMAEKALDPAVSMARAFGGNLRLVRVAPGMVSSDYIVDIHLHDTVIRQELVRVEEYLEKIRARYSEQALTVVTRVLEAGDPAQRILEEVQADPVDLIVLTSHGRTGITRLMLGSVAEHVARQATCPVLIVRQQESESP